MESALASGGMPLRLSTHGRHRALGYFIQEPDALFSFVQDFLQTIAGGGVAVLVADRNGGSLSLREVAIILQQPFYHLLRRHELVVVVVDRL